MDMVFSVFAIIVMMLVGASLLTLVGIVLSLGYYDREEVRAKYEKKQMDSTDLSDIVA